MLTSLRTRPDPIYPQCECTSCERTRKLAAYAASYWQRVLHHELMQALREEFGLHTMHPKTLDIQTFPDQHTADSQGYTVPLNEQEAKQLHGMNRKQRRAWLSAKRKQEKGKRNP